MPTAQMSDDLFGILGSRNFRYALCMVLKVCFVEEHPFSSRYAFPALSAFPHATEFLGFKWFKAESPKKTSKRTLVTYWLQPMRRLEGNE